MYLNFKNGFLTVVSQKKIIDDDVVSVFVLDDFVYSQKKEIINDGVNQFVEYFYTLDEVLNFIKDDYSTNRRIEYSKLNQFELFFNDKVNGTNTWQEAIESIKLKYPKP